MSHSTHHHNDSTSYSPFWPIFIVFAVLLLLQFLELKSRYDQRNQLRAASVEAASRVPKAQMVQQTLEKVGKDLIALSDGKTNEASRIIAEFDIRISGPATNAPAKSPAK